MDNVLLQGRFRDPVHRDSGKGGNPAHGLVIAQVLQAPPSFPQCVERESRGGGRGTYWFACRRHHTTDGQDTDDP